MYKHILFTTELESENRQVEDKAAAMGKLTNAKLSVIHVIEPMPSAYVIGEIGVSYDVREARDELIANAKNSLQPTIARLGITESDVIIKSGRVSSEVLLFAQQNNVDLIVTGSHGRHGLQLLLGSTANAILHGAKCDVLAVRFKD